MARAAVSGQICAELICRDLPDPIAVYLATPEEIDLSAFIETALKAGKTLVAPRWDGAAYRLARLRSLKTEDLRFGPMRVLEPKEEELVAPSEVATWLVPGLAFDKRGNRLGYGGGWYDRLMSQAGRDTRKLAVGYDFQLVDALPAEAHDMRVDEIVCVGRSVIGPYH